MSCHAAFGGTSVLTYLYLFSVIVGGVLLASSIFLGGHDDADIDADGGGDLDIDADADVELEADADGFDKDVGAHGDLGGFLFLFLSLRFWTFFATFFGLTGLTLDMFELVSAPWIGLALALGMGFGTGIGAMSLIRKLSRDTTGRTTSSRDYIGKTARVVVPFEGERVGKVRVDIKGSSVDLLATGLEDEGFSGKEEVLIVEMDGVHARVARLEPKKATSG